MYTLLSKSLVKLLSSIAKRLKLKQWAIVEDLRKSVKEAILNEDTSRGANLIFDIISIFVSSFIPYKITRWIVMKLFWFDTLQIFLIVLKKNQPTKDFPMLSTKQSGKPEAWEYSGRSWYFWLNTIAERYGWSEKAIANLDPDDAIGLYQEIIASQQNEREFYYGLSEVAYEYVPSTKKSRFRPLGKPDWMLHSTKTATVKKPTPKVKIPKYMMPAGNVVVLDG